jgi:protein TonB
MTSHEILKADILDILFDNRNKLYGAYSLRRHYEARLGTALATALSTALLIFLLAKPNMSPGAADMPKPDIILRTVAIPKPLTPHPLKVISRVQPSQSAQNSYVNKIKMVDNPDPDRVIRPLPDIEKGAIGTSNIEGAIPETQTVSIPAAPVAPEVTSTHETGLAPLERGPEFPGGTQAWTNFLNRYLHTPSDLDAGEKRTVLISFLVDADGLVTGFNVKQSGGSAFDNEVIRVLKKMPRWKPAIQNGHAIAVPFTQPVTFVGVEE